MHPPVVTLDVTTLEQTTEARGNKNPQDDEPALSRWKYAGLFIFQVILIILFFVLVDYKRKGDVVGIDGFEGTHVMIFIGFAYLMTFLRRYGYSATGFNFLLAAVSVQWAIICQFGSYEHGKLLIEKQSILEADIMSATVLITMGALLGVASCNQLLFLAFVEVAFASLNIYLMESKFEAADIGGSIAIHTFGAYFGLSASFFMNKFRKDKIDFESEPTVLNGPSYISDITAMIGTLFLWIYWPSFNSALADMDSKGHERCVLNTYLSLCASTVAAFAVSSLVDHNKKARFDMVHIQNSTLAGGVAVGAVSNMFITPGGALVIGSGAGVLSVLGYRFLSPKLDKLGIKDTCGVNNLHGMPGVLSGIISIIVAASATANNYGTEFDSVFAVAKNNTSVTGSHLALNQLYSLLMTLGISIISGAIAGFIAVKCYRSVSTTKQRLYNDDNDWDVPPSNLGHGI